MASSSSSSAITCATTAASSSAYRRHTCVSEQQQHTLRLFPDDNKHTAKDCTYLEQQNNVCRLVDAVIDNHVDHALLELDVRIHRAATEVEKQKKRN